MFDILKGPGVIAGLLALAASGSVALGKPALAAFFSDPATASTLTSLFGAATGLVAGFLKGVEG
jgi:hypothetical protein